MIAEKPSIAWTIYQSISGKKPEGKGNQNMHFDEKFFHHDAHFIVSAVTGHVYQWDFPNKYKNWQQTNPRDLFETETQKIFCDKGGT